MKKLMVAASGLVLAFAAFGHAIAEEHEHGPAKANTAFEKLKSLEGTWKGKAGDEGGPGGDVIVKYRVTSGGNAVEETLFAGMPHEMVTMYYVQGDGVSAVHYCSSGNHPRLKLSASKEPNTLEFAFAGAENFDPAKDMHVHDGAITLVDADHLKAEWRFMNAGKPAGAAKFDVTRVK